jgi:hypothetical protein
MTFTFKEYVKEEKSKTAYFTFGRMNPPTTGHLKLLDKLSSVAGKNPYYVYLSQSSDPKKNPLSYSDKVKHARKVFPKHARSILIDKKVKNTFDIAVALYDKGFTNVVMVVGGDRVTEFDTLLQKYNGVKARHGFYNFKSLKVVSAGQRDPDAKGVEGMSASKMRQFASENDFVGFSQGLPKKTNNKDAKKLFQDVRKGMNLKEEFTFKNHHSLEPVSEQREAYVKGELFELGDSVIIKESQERGEISWLGSNYVVVALSENQTKRVWLHNVEKYDESVLPTTLATLDPKLDRYLDRLINGRKYKKAIRYYLDYRREHPGDGERNLVRVAKIADLDIRNLKKTLHDMINKGLLPKHLATDKNFLKKNEEVDHMDMTKDKIDKEKASDKKKHDRLLDRARIRAAKQKNRNTK